LGLARPPDPGNLGLLGASTQVTWVWKVMSYPRNPSLARPQELGRGTIEP